MQSRDRIAAASEAAGVSAARAGLLADAGLRGRWEVICRDRFGREKWREQIRNLVTNAGEDYLLDVGLANGSKVATWYIGLIDSTPTVAETDTTSSHSGWTEVQDYDETTRQAFSPNAVSGQSVDNVGSLAAFTINANVTVGGMFLISESAKGGTGGTLYAAGAFSGGDKVLQTSDTLQVQATFTAGGA